MCICQTLALSITFPPAVVRNIIVLLLTVFGVGANKLPPGLPLRPKLLAQGIAYVSITILTCIPMAVSMRLLSQI